MAQLSNCSLSSTLPGAPGCQLYDLNAQPPGPSARLSVADTSVASLVVNPGAGVTNLVIPSQVRVTVTFEWCELGVTMVGNIKGLACLTIFVSVPLKAGVTSLTSSYSGTSSRIRLSVEDTYQPGWPQVMRPCC